MIEVEIPNDIKEYEPKLIGPFTTRQAICVIGFAITCVAFHFLIKSFTGQGTGLAIVIPGVLGIPWILVGYYKPYGMHFEQYFIDQLYTTILPPRYRRYKTENLYEQFDIEIDKEEKAKLSETSSPKNKKKRR